MLKPPIPNRKQSLHVAQGQLLAAANLGYITWYPDQSLCEVSSQCWIMIGLEPTVNTQYSDWTQRVVCRDPGFRWDELNQYVERSLMQPASIELETSAIDGTSRPLKMLAQFADPYDRSDSALITAIISEVDSLQRTVDALTETNLRFSSIVEGARVGLWHRNLAAGTGYWSKRFWELLGVESNDPDPPMAFFYKHVHPEDLETLHATRRAHLENRTPYDIEIRATGDDNQMRWFNLRGQAIWDDNGLPLRLAGSLEDITARKKSELQVESGRKFYRLIMNSMDDLLFVKDEHFRIQEANDAFLSLYPEEMRDQVIGSTTIEEYDEAQREEFLAEDRRALAEGVSETDEVIFFPGGEQRSLWTKKIRFEDQSGARFILGYARDVTRIKENERALLAANAELEEFAYRVSHDLRSPLESSVHLLDHLADALARGEVDESRVLLTTAQNSLGNLNSMAKDILDVHRIRHGELDAESVDIKDCIEQILERHRLDHKDVQLTGSYDLQVMPVVDPYGLELLLENLISNAVKYRDVERGNCRVAVDVHCDSRYLSISVSDNGLGIPIDNRAKLFGMFQRFHPRESFGSGLGLYMTKQWAERMGGAVEVTHLDHGTTFKVTIPQQKLTAAKNA